MLDTKDTIEFANRYVYPKLTSLIKKLEVDPSDQDLHPITLLFDWTKALPLSYSLKQTDCILRDHFLPKMLQTLQSWLDIVDLGHSEEVGEILIWYRGWKKFLLE